MCETRGLVLFADWHTSLVCPLWGGCIFLWDVTAIVAGKLTNATSCEIIVCLELKLIHLILDRPTEGENACAYVMISVVLLQLA